MVLPSDGPKSLPPPSLLSTMNAWKEKVADKLSRLLVDSTSTHGPLSSKVVSSAKKEPSHSAPSYASHLHSILEKTSSKVGNGIPNKSTNLLDGTVSSVWTTQNFSCKDDVDFKKANSENGNDDWNRTDKEEKEFISQQNMEASIFPTEEFSSYKSENSVPVLLHNSTLISLELFDFLQASLPNMVKGCQWVLLYSTAKHGISLQTLLRKSAGYQGSCVLIVGDKQGVVFGAMMDSAPNPTAKKKYQGTNHMFVFTTLYGEPRIFRPTGVNRYYYMCMNDLLAFGGGGSYAFCLEDDLLNGTSGCCDTYGNACLARSPEFEVKNVELWGFTYMPRYIS